MNCHINISDKIFHIISQSSHQIQQDSYLVGGYIRDCIIGHTESKDIDIVTVGMGIKLAEQVAKNLFPIPKVNVFKRFGTAMLKYQDKTIEFISARKESYLYNSRNPIVKNGTLADDQQRRDFTINTLAVSLNLINYGNIIDPFYGIQDIKQKIIRTPLNPDITYSDDPLRMLRAIRFATQLEFNIEQLSFESIRRNKERINIVSMERIIEEFQKILLSKKPSIGLKLLDQSGLLNIILPELTALKGKEEKNGYSHKDNFYHTLEVVDNISLETDFIYLRWAALLHDIGKTVTKKYIPQFGWTFHAHELVGAKMIPKIFYRLKLPMGNDMKYVQKLIKYSSRPISLIKKESTDSAIRRLLFDAGNHIEDLIMLCKADITTKNIIKRKKYINNFILVKNKIYQLKDKDRLRNWQSPISGFEIMTIFNLQPCKIIGVIKNSLKEAILDGKIQNKYSYAYDFVLKKGIELGLKSKNIIIHNYE